MDFFKIYEINLNIYRKGRLQIQPHTHISQDVRFCRPVDKIRGQTPPLVCFYIESRAENGY